MESRYFNLKTVDEYVAKTPKEGWPKIKELRSVILEAVPGIEESIKWGQPYYSKDGMLVGFDVYKDYVRFGFGPTSFAQDLRQKLEAKGYKTGGRTIQIKFDQDIPKAEITKIIKDQAHLNSTKQRS